MKIIPTTFALATPLFAPFLCAELLLAEFTFGGATPTLAQQSAPGVTVSAFSGGNLGANFNNNLSAQNAWDSATLTLTPAANDVPNASSLSLANWAGNYDAGNYASFTLTPGAPLYYESIRFEVTRGGDANHRYFQVLFGDVGAAYADLVLVGAGRRSNYTQPIDGISYADVNARSSATPSSFAFDLTGLPSFQGTATPKQLVILVRTSNASYSFDFDNIAVVAIPEPGTLLLAALSGLAAVPFLRRRRPACK